MLFLYTNYLDVFEGINSTGIQTIELEVGKEYTFVSSVSGYSRTVTISEDMSDVYVMPEEALYWYGNECTDKSGGWYSTGYSQSGWSVNSGTKNINKMYIKASGNDSNYISLLGTSNIVPLSNYTKLHIECKTSGQTNYPLQVLICTSKTNIFSSAVLNVTLSNTDTQIITLDISSISSNYLLFMCTAYASRYGYVYNVWAE